MLMKLKWKGQQNQKQVFEKIYWKGKFLAKLTKEQTCRNKLH